MGVVAYLSLSGSGREVGWGGRLFEAGRLLTFSALRMGAYSRWALIRGWALIRINTVIPEGKETKYKLRKVGFLLPKIKTQRFKTTFVNGKN